MDFEQRLERARAGSEVVWQEIYNDLAGPVTGYLRSRGAKDPEDLAGEVFLQVARDLHRFKGNEAKFRSWVFVIAHRRLVDSRRTESRRAQISPIDASVGLSIGGDVEEEAIQNLAEARMREVFDTLTEDQRHVLALRILADLSIDQTARVLGKRPGAIKALQRRGLQAVRTEIEKGRVRI